MKWIAFLLIFVFNFAGFSQSSFSQLNELAIDSISAYSTSSSFFRKTKSLVELSPSLGINPAFEATIASSSENGFYQRFGAGFQAEFQKKKWSSNIIYLNSLGQYMDYRTDLINQKGIVPSSLNKNGTETINSTYVEGFINFKASEIFDFELGYGNNFFGYGHRSLLVSDNAGTAPYANLRAKFWKLSYSSNFALYQDNFGVEGRSELYRTKFTASHFLDLQLTSWLNIGLFETIIWQANEPNYSRGFDLNYLNPVIFYRPVEFSTGSSDNALVGMNLGIKLKKSHLIYGQLLFDEFLLSEIRADLSQYLNPEDNIRSGWWANKYGIQIGVRSSNIFKIKGLNSRLEYNLVRPFTYAHSSPTQSYSNLNQALAHPLGANFEETILILNYLRGKWIFSQKFTQSHRGLSTLGGNVGENIELSNSTRNADYENSLTQGLRDTRKYSESFIGYTIKEEWQAVLSIGYVWRESDALNYERESMIFLSFKTNLFNQYFDY